MARRIRWQILIATASSLLVLALMSYLAVTAAAVAKPLAGGDYIEVVGAPPQHLNPLSADPSADPSAADIQALIFEGLMRVGDDGLPEPALAQSEPEIDETGRVYVFTLRPGLLWHDGQPVTADDVLFTLRAVQTPGFVGNQQTGAIWDNVIIDKISDTQIRCTLPAPFAPFASLATFPILPEHLLGAVPLEQWATDAFNQRPIGTGPYQLAELNSQHALLEANPSYYGDQPFIEKVELRFSTDRQDALAALSRGEISGVGFAGTGDASSANAPRGATRYTVPLDAYTTLTFNLREGPLADQGLRRALALGLDKDVLIAQALEGQAARLDTPILAGWWASVPGIQWYAADSGRAAEALATLGYEAGPDGVRARDGQPLVLPLLTDDAPDRLAAAREIARQWGELGVRVELEQVDAATLRDRLESRQFTMALHGWQRQGPDPDVAYGLWHSSRALDGQNYAGLQDDEIDRQLAVGRENVDEATRLAAYTAFQSRWIDLTPSITLYQPLYVYITSSELGGLELASDGDDQAVGPVRAVLFGREDRFRTINRWFINSGREIQGDLR